jgi:hypothetical protein
MLNGPCLAQEVNLPGHSSALLRAHDVCFPCRECGGGSMWRRRRRSRGLLTKAQSANEADRRAALLPPGCQIHSRCKPLCAPALTTFSRIMEPKRPFRVLPKGIRGFEDMGALHQLAIGLLAAAFSIGLLITARHFIEYRSARSPAFTFIEQSHVPL